MHKEEMKKIIFEFFRLIDPDIRVDFPASEENTINVCVKIKDPESLIGEKGRTLVETERLFKIIARKKSKDPLFVNLDINDYKKRKGDQLKELANSTADEVSLTGIGKKFPPMSAYERRIIHMALAEREDVLTESVDEGSQRRVVIKKS